MAVDLSPFQNYSESIFDDILGYDDIKGYITLAFKSDEQQHLWFNGPPACAKSLLIEKLEEIGGRLIYGSKVTKEGLIRIMIEEKPVLMMIDEIEKVRELYDLSPLLTWTEDGRVKSDTGKEREDYKLESKKWMVFAASNSISRFVRGKKSMPELLSRFEVFQLPTYQKNEFEKIVCNVLTHKEGLEKPIAQHIAMNLSERLTFNVREAQRIARLVKHEENPYMSIKTILDVKDKYRVQP